MSILSALQALTPTVYWPMDDTNSAIARDASGNSHPGTILTATAAGAPGPESGTTCFATSAALAGVQIAGTNPLTGQGPFSMVCWIASASYASSNNRMTYNGLSNSTGAGLMSVAGTPTILVGGAGSLGSGFALSTGFWHMVGFTINPAVTQLVYVDGATPFSAAAGTPNTVAGTNPLLANTPDPALIAHAAFWGRVVTPTEFAALFAAGPGIVPAPAVTGRNATDADILALETKLDTILASVRKSYS